MSTSDPGMIENPAQMTLPEAFRRAEQMRTDAVLQFFDREFTYQEIREYVDALAAAWQDRGIQQGDAILIQLQNVPQFIFTALAAWEIGAVTVPVSPMYKAREVRRIQSDSQAVAWVTTPNIWERQGTETLEDSSLEQVYLTKLEDFGAGLPEKFAGLEDADVDIDSVPQLHSLVDTLESFTGRTPRRATLQPSDTANFTYTSGTTGPPKAALTTHGNMAFVGYTYPAFHGASGPGHTVLATAPLVHITGLAMHLGSWLMHAQKLVLTYRFDPKIQLDAMVESQASWTTGAATAFLSMLQVQDETPRDFSSLKFLGSGGAPIPTELAQRIEKFYGVALSPGYGLTESTGAVTSTPIDEQFRVDEASGIISVGRAFDGASLKIVDEDGNEQPTGERGEILLRGPGIVAGYWQNADETSNVFLDGWLKTGDVGFVDEDSWLYIVDRTKNMIVASGYKVWPREVEDVLYQVPGIHEAAVVGVPDDYRGETVVAAVSLSDPDKRANWDDFEEQLRQHCKKHLANYKVPSRFIVKNDLPKNFNGKIQHREIVAEVASQ